MWKLAPPAALKDFKLQFSVSREKEVRTWFLTCPNSFPVPCAVSVHEIYQTVFGGSNSSCYNAGDNDYYGFDEDPLYAELNSGKMCQSSPAVAIESCSDLVDFGQNQIRAKRRNRIITNPRLFVQTRNKFTM